ncbi:DUF2813 domain-containing protein [Rhizobium leguminosarum bv. viciae]|uniref:AAA family ATPase n=1 Tax=Rhizobium leguminosarum TaxID=384 RepID=A0A6P0B052_RHILE|nr:ATP-binding protein [Rhizobium leguminosarum]MBY5487100.1 AAA family ATPase [Rhizobium leguminosarum]NEI32556.1 AAA family ATPase [Rhizobium leguminosarum]NEI39315.1 AAA family ATPase [Rhizobium leguminosarum]TBZ28670.1 DUF2813 domain-containing protein [Rhizobium leguminosarum bv. viciae]
MTIIREVEIRNFRGVSHLKWWPSPGINCLIGPGDSGKSTILDAIDLCIGSRQNFTFTDADFHLCNVAEPIIIDITLGNLDDELGNLETYGHFLRGRDISTGQLDNETSAALETVLTVRLVVRDDLEAQWLLFSPGASAEGREKSLQWKHRQKIAPVRLGAAASHHMALGPRSVLGKLSADATQASSALASASRQARQAFADQGCQGVDAILETSRQISSAMGIHVDEVKALLDVKGISLSGGAISLHDQDQVPMRNLGSGSMRLLVVGLQKAVGRSSIFIVDELEFGLEPYRIVRLLDSLGAKRDDASQQVFLTTHSPIVLRELSSGQLFAVRAFGQNIPPIMNGEAIVQPARKVKHNWVTHLGHEEAAQKTLRACAEAFLAPSVIVCEGKTEIGLIRGIDLNCQDTGQRSILSYGSHWADGGGSTMMERAKIFTRMGYRTALFMDSDVLYTAQIYEDLRLSGITVFRWAEGFSTESALFASVPAILIPGLLGIACDWRGEDSVDARIRNASNGNLTLQLCRGSFAEEMRPALGRAAGEGKWFKDIEPAERAMREVVAPQWVTSHALFKTPIELLWQWVAHVPAGTVS